MNHKQLSCLVERARTGDVEAFAQIYRELSGTVYYLALNLTKNKSDAEDIVQNTMIELYKNLGTIKNPQALVAYVNRIAYYSSLRVIRRTEPLSSIERESIVENIPVDERETLPEEYVENKEERERILKLVQELPETQRMVVLLYYYQQLPTKQIAQIMNIEEDAVRNRLSRARASLKKKLYSFLKEETIMAVFGSKLSIILQKDAYMALAPETSGHIWQAVGTELGFPSTTITATLPSATAPPSTVPIGSVVLGSAAGSYTGIAAAAIFIVCAMSVGVWIFGGERLFETDQPSLQMTEILDNSVPLTDGIPDEIDIPSKANELAQSATISPESGVSAEADDVEVATPTSSAGDGEHIIVANNFLRYPVGSAVTEMQIIADSGARITGTAGESAIDVRYFETIHFNKPNDYAVYLEVYGADNPIENRRVVVIRIE